MKATAQIFLSYAREDEGKVEKFYQKLSDAGFKPWMDKKDILPGEQWKSCIQKAIRCSDFFLACLSTNSVSKRGYLQKEIKDALDIWQEKLEDDIYLIPVRLEVCEVPESLCGFQWVNLFEKGGWTRLVRAIQVGMERRAEVPANQELSPGTEMATPEECPERVCKMNGGFGERLRKLREQKGWTQYQLAREFDCDATMINLWESGKRVPRHREDIVGLGETLELDLEEINKLLELAGLLPNYPTEEDKARMGILIAERPKGTLEIKAGSWEALHFPRLGKFVFDECGSLYHNWLREEGIKIKCHYTPEEIPLSKDVEEAKQTILDTKGEGVKRGGPGAKFKLHDFWWPHGHDEESEFLHLDLRPSDYYAFFGTNLNLDEKAVRAGPHKMVSLREKYGIKALDLARSPFANCLFVQFLVVTRGDEPNKVILMQRSEKVDTYPGVWSATFGEMMDRNSDFVEREMPSPLVTVLRGAKEELGFGGDAGCLPALDPQDVRFLGLLLEKKSLCPGLVGIAYTSKKVTAKDVMESWRSAVHKQEHGGSLAINFTPREVARYLGDREWNPTSRLCLTLGLLYTYGWEEVNQAFS